MMKGEELGREIWAVLQSQKGKPPEELWSLIGKTLVEYLQKNAEVKSTVTTSAGSGTGEGKIL